LLLTLAVLIVGLLLTARWFPHEKTLGEIMAEIAEAFDQFKVVLGMRLIPAVESATAALRDFALAFSSEIDSDGKRWDQTKEPE
jgi:hypothetical protein